MTTECDQSVLATNGLLNPTRALRNSFPEPPCPGQVRAVRDGASRRYSYERWGEQGFNVSAPIVLFPPAPSAKLVSCVPVPNLSLHFVLFICPRNVPVQLSYMLCTKSQMNFDFYVLSSANLPV